jgi:hypothetical protein
MNEPRGAAQLPVVVALRRRAEQLLEDRRAVIGRGAVGADALEALQRELARHLRVLGAHRLVTCRADDQLVAEALEVGEQHAVARARHRDVLAGQALLPEGQRLGRPDAPDDPVDHPGTRAARDRPRVLEEGELRSRAPALVGVEEVIDARVVLVDGLGHQPQAEDARVEIDVARRVPGDRGDVVDAVEAHQWPIVLKLIVSQWEIL